MVHLLLVVMVEERDLKPWALQVVARVVLGGGVQVLLLAMGMPQPCLFALH
jgi:hypothetical protein